MPRLPGSRKTTHESQTSFNTQEFIGAPVESLREEYLVAHVDGGARGNPGPAGYGVVVEDRGGRRIEQLSEFLGVQTNNYAEYSGLIAALEYAVRGGYTAVKIYSDSELMVKQIKGEYKVRSAPLQELHARAKSLIRKLDTFTIQHVRREKNREADALANAAMDRGELLGHQKR